MPIIRLVAHDAAGQSVPVREWTSDPPWHEVRAAAALAEALGLVGVMIEDVEEEAPAF